MQIIEKYERDEDLKKKGRRTVWANQRARDVLGFAAICRCYLEAAGWKTRLLAHFLQD